MGIFKQIREFLLNSYTIKDYGVIAEYRGTLAKKRCTALLKIENSEKIFNLRIRIRRLIGYWTAYYYSFDRSEMQNLRNVLIDAINLNTNIYIREDKGYQYFVLKEHRIGFFRFFCYTKFPINKFVMQKLRYVLSDAINIAV